jgi:hypothetical protein
LFADAEKYLLASAATADSLRIQLAWQWRAFAVERGLRRSRAEAEVARFGK